MQRQWQDPERFIAEVVTRSGLLIPDTGRVEDARAFSFPHRTFREFLAATALERDMGAWAAGLGLGLRRRRWWWRRRRRRSWRPRLLSRPRW
ncbi:MAG: hypothetical protein IPO67_31955 [Deltaproteobacteria bacterium]|nr:hypothetical protein [Deltaproteobacteria bacterium]